MVLVLLWILQTNPFATERDVAEGAEIYRLRCADCHGPQGEGGRGPNLRDGVFYHGATDADLRKTIESGIPGTEMPGLVFAGSHEGYFYALDGETGQELFRIYLGGDGLGGIGGGAAMYAAPITYMVKERQYVSMPSGSALFTFALE